MARHAAWLASRVSARASGRTAHEEALDSEWKGDLCIFGESVLFREAARYTGQMVGNRVRKKADLQWHRGVYLGRAEQTNEHIVGSKEGIFMTRNVRRLPVDQRRDPEGVRSMVGVPWAAQRVSAAPKPKNPAAGAGTCDSGARVRGTCRGTSGCERGKQLEQQQQRCGIGGDGGCKRPGGKPSPAGRRVRGCGRCPGGAREADLGLGAVGRRRRSQQQCQCCGGGYADADRDPE